MTLTRSICTWSLERRWPEDALLQPVRVATGHEEEGNLVFDGTERLVAARKILRLVTAVLSH